MIDLTLCQKENEEQKLIILETSKKWLCLPRLNAMISMNKILSQTTTIAANTHVLLYHKIFQKNCVLIKTTKKIKNEFLQIFVKFEKTK